MKTKLIIGIVVGFTLLMGLFKVGSFYNHATKLTNLFEQKTEERTAFYQKMYVVIQQQTQITVKNDESFKEVLNTQVNGQKNGENVMFAWIQQSNPTATYSEVSKLYTELNRNIEANRSEFFEQEKVLQDVSREYKDYIKTFPNNIIADVLGFEKIDYKPIVSTKTLKVFETGIEDDIELDLGSDKNDTVK